MRRVLGREAQGFAARYLIAASLGVDAWVHANLASLYDAVGRGFTEGALFRLEAAFASLAALLVLSLRRRLAFGLAALVAGSALLAVILYRYVDVGAIGPVPNLYEPSWFFEKAVSAVAEGSAFALAALAWSPLGRRITEGGSILASNLRQTALRTGVLVAVTAAVVLPASLSVAPSAAPNTSVGGEVVQRVTIDTTDRLRFEPADVNVRPGRVVITLVDTGSYPHNLVIPRLHVSSASVTGDPGGQRVVFAADFPHPGRYRFYCAYHMSAGMVGVFIVR